MNPKNPVDQADPRDQVNPENPVDQTDPRDLNKVYSEVSLQVLHWDTSD